MKAEGTVETTETAAEKISDTAAEAGKTTTEAALTPEKAAALIRKALESRKRAYTPYSGFAVGAALEAEDGTVFGGCNIENAAHTPACCAERTAFFQAVFAGNRKFRRIAIVGGKADEAPKELCAPCGVCRQVMMEFCDPETFEIILAVDDNHYRTYLLKELLPMGFGPQSLE